MSYPLKGLGVAATSALPGLAVAVTGATGFIGGRLVERLREHRAEVTCLVRGAADTRLHQAGARMRAVDLADADAVRTALQGIDIVFHLAFDWDDTAWNARAMTALIDGCLANACSRLVHASSFVVYQVPDEGELTETSPDTAATEGYAHTKLALENELLRAVRERGLPGTVVQPTIVYGPRSRPWTMDPADMLRFGTVVLPMSGHGVCNAVYVDDVVDAMILAALQPGAIGRRYLVSGPPTTWRHFYERMADAAGAKRPQYWPPQAIARVNDRPRLLSLMADRGRLIRGIARKAPVSQLVRAGLRLLPGGLRLGMHERLFGKATRRRGFVHVPDPGRMDMLQGRSTISSGQARTELGYVPAFDFDAGMLPTARYLRDAYSLVD